MELAGQEEDLEGAALDPGAYAYANPESDERRDGAGVDAPPESKRAKKEPVWHQYTVPVENTPKKRICIEAGCKLVIHHG